MTPDLNFDGYNSFSAGPLSDWYARWAQQRTDLDVSLSMDVPVTVASAGKMNLEVNALIKYLLDPTGWQSPCQTLTKQTGDCKDYALLKYAVLLKAGLSEDALRIAIGHIATLEPGNQEHAWCAAYLEGSWWALDSKFGQLVKARDYINWVPEVSLSGMTVKMYGKQVVLSEALKEHDAKG